MFQDTFDGSGRPPVSGDLADRYEAIRTSLLGLPADEIARQLPNLVETVGSNSAAGEQTIQFTIGVSFSLNRSPFDYWLERLVDIEGRERPRLETLKPAVSSSHRYLRFSYPPDPEFDAGALRGALLAAIEAELARAGWPADPEGDGDETGRGWGDGLWKHLGRS